DLESDTKILERHISPTPHDAMLIRWRIRVASRSSSPTNSTTEIPTAPILPVPSAIVAPSSEFPLAPVVAPPEIHRRRAILIQPAKDILIGRLYRTHPSGPYTTVTDSSTPSRFVHLPLAKTLWCSEVYLCWRSAPLSTMYPPTTSKSLAGDSSFKSSVGPSRKRCMPPTTTVTLSIHDTRALVPSRAELLPPQDIKAEATNVEVAVDRDVKAGIDAGIGMKVDARVDVEDEVKDEVESCDRGTMEVGVDMVAGIDIPDGMLMPDAIEHLELVEEGLHDIYEHVIELPLQRIEDIEMGQRELKARSLIFGHRPSDFRETFDK
nr:hypothetical protein [Tanacetum cinerariifolium]